MPRGGCMHRVFKKILRLLILFVIVSSLVLILFRTKFHGTIRSLAETQVKNSTSDLINDAIDKQFAAVNFVLDQQENIVVAFRGTDVTVTGVKESAMLSYMFPVPAQIQALHYFQETAMTYKGDVRICGHSKGGNLAVFAGVSCSNSLKKRIVGVYQNDAPGFPKHFYDRYDYQQIKDKIFFPVIFSAHRIILNVKNSTKKVAVCPDGKDNQ